MNRIGVTEPSIAPRGIAVLAAVRAFIKRLNGNSAHPDYEAVERGLFGGRYRYSNKNDDDLRIFPPPR